jgi:hypothetical protein
MQITGQLPTRIQDMLEMLATGDMCKGEQLAVTIKCVFPLKVDQNEDEWTMGSRKAEREWMKEHHIE